MQMLVQAGGILMPTKLKRVKRLVGKKGLACFGFAFAFLAIAFSYVFDEPTATTAQNLHFLTSVMPLEIWGILWAVGGLLFLLGAFWKKFQLVSFLIGVAITANWSVGHLIQTLIGLSYRGYVSFFIYGLFTFFILLIASWSEPIEIEEGKDSDG